MTEHPISAYLVELEIELKLKNVARRRILEEAEDHLRATSEELVAAGRPASEAEREAIRRFGRAATIARGFAEHAAGRAALKAATWGLASLLVFVCAAIAVALTAPRYLLDFPQGLPTWFGLQIAAVASLICLVRWLRWRREPHLPAAASTPLAASALIATAALAVAGSAEVVIAVSRPSGGWQAGRTEALVFIGAAVIAVAASLAAVAAAARTYVLAPLPHERKRSDPRSTLIGDITVLSPRLGRMAAGALSRPAHLVFSVTATASIAVVSTQLLADDFAGRASVVLAAAGVGVLEGIAVAVCYLAFGRALGLRAVSPLPPLR
jgi:hypothetical protein